METILPGRREGLDRARSAIYQAFMEGRTDANMATARLLTLACYARAHGASAAGRRLARLTRDAREGDGYVARKY
jgi:hypothetical protein